MGNRWYENDSSARGEPSNKRPLHVVHIALQGCIKSGDISYGLTADTGGHIRYLLDEVRALREAGVAQSVLTRAFADASLGREYQQQSEILMPGVTLQRLHGSFPGYLSKEDIHCDLDALTDALVLWLQNLPRLPDMLHAHYADAGILALRMRERFGIPFIFTAHSLGAVKARCLTLPPGMDEAVSKALERRIASEQRVIDHADLLIASSEDEAEGQYGLYRQTSGARPISVNPPGCDLKRFGEPAPCDRVITSLRRFLSDPDKPILLCLARPVRKKNLIGVIDAYAKDPILRACANLVIFAGTRGDLADQEPECAEVLQAIVDRVEHHDLYGSIAFPKQHLADDVPAIYQHAARSGSGARPGLDGLNATAFPSGVQTMPVEATEQVGPLIVWRKELCSGSGGAGQHRGGLGQAIEISAAEGYRFEFSAMCDRTEHPARGRQGGLPGKAGVVALDDGTRLRAKGRQAVPADRHLVLDLPGGGGHGSPQARERSQVKRDLRNDYILRNQLSDYGADFES